MRGRDKQQVERALRELESLEKQTFQGNQSIRKISLPSEKTIYIYGSGMKFRLLLALDGDECRITDIVDRERLKRLPD